jgi:hypothetical protein
VHAQDCSPIVTGTILLVDFRLNPQSSNAGILNVTGNQRAYPEFQMKRVQQSDGKGLVKHRHVSLTSALMSKQPDLV